MTEQLISESLLAADDKKALDIALFDLQGKSDICDYQIICSGDNIRHTAALANEIKKRCLESTGKKPLHVEGLETAQWIVIDYGSLIIHIFIDEIRNYYALDALWEKQSIENWSEFTKTQ